MGDPPGHRASRATDGALRDLAGSGLTGETPTHQALLDPSCLGGHRETLAYIRPPALQERLDRGSWAAASPTATAGEEQLRAVRTQELRSEQIRPEATPQRID